MNKLTKQQKICLSLIALALIGWFGYKHRANLGNLSGVSPNPALDVANKALAENKTLKEEVATLKRQQTTTDTKAEVAAQQINTVQTKVATDEKQLTALAAGQRNLAGGLVELADMQNKTAARMDGQIRKLTEGQERNRQETHVQFDELRKGLHGVDGHIAQLRDSLKSEREPEGITGTVAIVPDARPRQTEPAQSKIAIEQWHGEEYRDITGSYIRAVFNFSAWNVTGKELWVFPVILDANDQEHESEVGRNFRSSSQGQSYKDFKVLVPYSLLPAGYRLAFRFYETDRNHLIGTTEWKTAHDFKPFKNASYEMTSSW